MKPVKPVIEGFPVVIYAEDQPEYFPLPVIKCQDGTVISRWKLSFKERLKILFKGNLYLSICTFNQPLQPLNLDINPPKLTLE